MTELFDKLDNKQRWLGRNLIEDYEMGDTNFSGENKILRELFSNNALNH